MKSARVLIVEDESIVAMEIEKYVRQLGYPVAGVCAYGKRAVAIAAQTPVDIVLMDIHIKGDRDGIETAEMLREAHPQIQVIFLTAHMDDYHVNRAIALDPIAYLAKPFHKEELRVFLKIAVQKQAHTSPEPQMTSGHRALDHEFACDEAGQTLYCCHEPMHLTQRETQLLMLFLNHTNTVLDLYTIENEIWPDKHANANTIRTLVKRLREKLKHRFIETVPSLGYRFVLPGIIPPTPALNAPDSPSI